MDALEVAYISLRLGCGVDRVVGPEVWDVASANRVGSSRSVTPATVARGEELEAGYVQEQTLRDLHDLGLL